MVAVCHLGFIWDISGPSTNIGTVGGLYRCAKFGCDQCSSFNNRLSLYESFNIPCIWLENAYSRPKIGVLWRFYPVNGVQ